MPLPLFVPFGVGIGTALIAEGARQEYLGISGQGPDPLGISDTFGTIQEEAQASAQGSGAQPTPDTQDDGTLLSGVPWLAIAAFLFVLVLGNTAVEGSIDELL